MLQILESCYSFISNKLKSQKQPDFVFGYRPSTLDVLLIAHLARIKENSPILQAIVQGYPELTSYFERMMGGYFIPFSKDETTQISNNRFLRENNVVVELCSKKNCYIERKAPCRSISLG